MCDMTFLIAYILEAIYIALEAPGLFKEIVKETVSRKERAVSWLKVLLMLGSIINIAVFTTFYIKSNHIINNTSANETNIPKMKDDRDLSKLKEYSFSASDWSIMGDNEKMTFLKMIADIENDYLNISREFTLKCEAPDYGARGYYVYYDNTINISNDVVHYCDLDSLIETVCHEAFHAYQFELVEAYENGYVDDATVALYSVEFDNYISGEDDFEAYYLQRCELDARSYAEKAKKLYMQEVIR